MKYFFVAVVLSLSALGGFISWQSVVIENLRGEIGQVKAFCEVEKERMELRFEKEKLELREKEMMINTPAENAPLIPTQ